MDLLLMSRTPVTLVMRGSSKKCHKNTDTYGVNAKYVS